MHVCIYAFIYVCIELEYPKKIYKTAPTLAEASNMNKSDGKLG